MGPQARIQNLYIEEVKGLSQMLFGKILPDCNAMEALRSLAMQRARCVFGFCADFLLDAASANVMQFLVPDRPHVVFHVKEARPHMHRNVAFYFGCGIPEDELSVRGKPAFDEMHDKLLAACLLHSDFAVWHHVSYEKLCCSMYARAVELGIRSVLITGGDVDDDQKLNYLTDFDNECADARMVFSTAAVTVGMNFKKRFNACVVVTGRNGSTAVDAAQSAGRPGRVDGLEFDTILWLIKDAGPPQSDEELASMAFARRTVERKRLDKTRYASRISLETEVVPLQLFEVKVVNEMDQINKQSHTALTAQRLVEYKPGWKCIDPVSIELPPRLAALSDSDVNNAITAAKPLPLDQIQRIA